MLKLDYSFLKKLHLILSVLSTLCAIVLYLIVNAKTATSNELVFMQTITMLLTLSIPLFIKHRNKIKEKVDEDLKMKSLFMKWNLILLLVAFGILCFNMVTYCIVPTSSLFLSMLMAWILCVFFCRPELLPKEMDEDDNEKK